jgi:hypothetical protein
MPPPLRLLPTDVFHLGGEMREHTRMRPQGGAAGCPQVEMYPVHILVETMIEWKAYSFAVRTYANCFRAARGLSPLVQQIFLSRLRKGP